ncbi:MAG: hypothetical protein ACPGNV_11895 [Mangrovicoccus sp.]
MTDARPSQIDPKALIYESYRIDPITPADCRTIFFDWALSLPDGQDQRAAIAALLELYGTGAPHHPMTDVLREGLGQIDAPRRRGGGRARRP